MSGLTLLSVYSSSDSDDDDDDSDAITKKARLVLNNSCVGGSTRSDISYEVPTSIVTNKWEPLPIPNSVQNMFLDAEEQVELCDDQCHGNKIRSFPHERGIWATYVYVEYLPEPVFHDMINDVIRVCKSQGISLDPVEHFHISLSRTVKLRHHWIVPFIEDLKAELRHTIKFKVMLQSVEVYANDEKTRTFIGLKVHVGLDNLKKIIDKVNKCLKDFKLPFFYEDPSFHISFASCVGDLTQRITLSMAEINACADSHLFGRSIYVTSIHCKTGNKIFAIPLQSGR